jgi:hypothetical protein
MKGLAAGFYVRYLGWLEACFERVARGRYRLKDTTVWV